jgi:hypothetical protein
VDLLDVVVNHGPFVDIRHASDDTERRVSTLLQLCFAAALDTGILLSAGESPDESSLYNLLVIRF